MRFPSIKAVAADLRDINANVQGECDVRLQVYSDGMWAIRYGPTDYDQDHRGFWGASCIPGVNARGTVQRFDSVGLARELIEQVREDHAQAEACGMYA